MTVAAVPRHDRRRLVRWRIRSTALLALGLILIVEGMFFFWPIVDILLRSLNPNGDLVYSAHHFGLSNYSGLFSDRALRVVTKNTLVLAGLATVTTVVLAFPAAYLMSRVSRRTSVVLMTLVLIPFWVSILVRLFALSQILATNGIVNQVLGHLGLGPYSLLFNTTATVIGMVNYLLPFMLLILYSAMVGVDPSLTLAAKTAGASSWQSFRSIYLPLVKNAIIAGALLVFVISLGFFLTPAILGGPQDTTLSVYIQQEVQNYSWGASSAAGIVLLAVTVIGFAIAMRLTGAASLVTHAGASQKGVARAERLGHGVLSWVLWAAMAINLVILLLPLAIVIPISVEQTSFVTWPPSGFTLHWYSIALHDPTWRGAALKSAKVGLLVTAISVVLGFLGARLLVSMRSRTLRALFLGIVYAPLVVPVILLAIGTFDTQTQAHLIGSIFGLALVHSTLALPFTVTVLTNAVAGLDPAMERAAWTLGASRIRTLRSVILPVIVPSLVGAGLLAFMTSWDEAVVALFQTGFSQTLPVAFFSYIKSGVQPTIAAIGTMLVLLIMAGVLVYWIVHITRTYRRARLRRSLVAEAP